MESERWPFDGAEHRGSDMTWKDQRRSDLWALVSVRKGSQGALSPLLVG